MTKHHLIYLCLGIGIISLIVSLSPGLAWASPTHQPHFDRHTCTFNGISLHGKVKIVEHFPDLKVEIVEHFPDLKVKWVEHFPDNCGEWQLVENFPDFEIQYVSHFPDLKIRPVDHFPGLP